ncbi:MAG TPA: inorganic phosphate transporter [Nitrososphaerales archaeon]|nr:inorganic phosphate transporter [Nitrososphaerales archaeon]
MDSLLVGLAAALSFVFGWNNSSLLIGNVRGSGTLSYGTILVLAIAGLLLGSFLEGPKMAGSLVGSLAPTASTSALTATIFVSLALTLAMTLLKLPVSFSMVMVGAFIGSTLASAVAVDAARSLLVVAFWFVAPLGTALLTYLIYRGTKGLVSGFGILAVDSLNRSGSLVSAFAVSYTLGANNIGMFFGSTGGASGLLAEGEAFALLALAAVLGVVLLGRNSLGGTVGDRMLALSPQGVFSAFVASSLVVWAGTQFAFPVSITQCLIGGMLGAAFSRHVSIVNTKLVAETVSLWVLAPLAALALAYLATMAL